MVMLGLLALFTLIAVTFVVASGQFRRGASAAASAERMGDPFDTLLHQALMQVARGSNHPQSAIGPHSLLEDMYGNGDAVTGCCFIDGSLIGVTPPQFIYTNPTGANLTQRAGRTQPYKGMTSPGGSAAPMLIEIGAVSFGWDREPGMALVDDNKNFVVDDAAEVPDNANDLLAGDDCFLGATYAHPAMVGEDPSAWTSVWEKKQMVDGSPLPLIDNVENYYAGRVITFVNGDAAGQSAYIVRSKLIPVTPTTTENVAFRTVLYIQPFLNGAQPSHKDRFVINGRAFNGAGFGYNPYVAASAGSLTRKSAFIGSAPNLLPNPALRALDMPYSEPFIKTPANDGAVYAFDMIRGNGFPMSLLPNPVDGGYRDYLNRYNSIIDADEDYDAPDEQNMLLSYSVWVPSVTGSDSGRYRTIMPSLHRPDLVKYFTNQPGMAVAKPGSLAYPRWHDVPPHVRRRYILRPDPSDHYDWTQELGATQPQNSDGWTPGEPFQDLNNNGQWDPIAVVNGVATPEPYTDLPNPKPNQMYDIGDRAYFNTGFDAMDGPWDVDNDNDNLPDSIWVDLGAPVTTAPDGRMVKPMFAVLVRDLDGRINVNAHGSVKHYDSLPNASSGYSAYTKPTQFQSAERVRMGNYAWSMYQTEPNVTVTSPDTLKVHTAGEPESSRDSSTFRDVPFQGIWALPYFGDGPYYVNTPAYPRVNPGAKATYYDIYKPSTTTLVKSSVQDVDSNRIPDSPWYEEGGERMPVYRVVTANIGGPRPVMFDLKGAVGTNGGYDPSRHIRGFEPAVGQGWSVCDVNLAQVLQAGPWGTTRMPNSNSTNTTANPTAFTSRNDYRYLLEGVPHQTGSAVPRSGRYGESYLLAPSAVAYPGLNGPRAGATDALMFFSHLLNESGTALPSVASAPPQRGDDDYPAAPSRAKAPSSDGRFARGGAYRNAFMPVIATLPVPASSMTPYGVTVPLPADPRYSPSVFTNWLHGDFGTPGDPDGDGSVALDVNGQPVFLKMGTANEEIDDPTEINLHRRYFVQSYFGVTATTNAAGVPLTTDLDAPFAPAEMERVLRARDSASVTLPSRLSDSLRDEGGGGEIDNYDLRRSITTESWDVPCPHVAPTPELAAAMRALNLPLNNPSIVDLLRARFYLATGQNPSATLALQAARLATVAMRSYRWQSAAETPPLPISATADEKAQFPGNVRLTKAARKRWHTRLLSPDLGQGLRMDVNAPFGNGFDDNNNGVVDEPMEWVGAVFPNGSIYNAFYFDGNRDGNFSINQAGVQVLDEEPRQQFAKELYCLMMLLIDQNYVEPLPTSVAATATAGGVTYLAGAESLAAFGYTGSDILYPYITDTTSASVGSTAAKDKLRRWLTARRIAQWAINVVDFRDRDSIMTPFEFDADPFYDNDADAAPNPPATASAANLQAHFPNTNGTWDVDGYLIPTAMADGFDDTNRAWRGVVWGCEYPDLLLTETAAFHDRRTQNLTSTAASGTNYLDFDVTPNTLTAVGTGGNVTDTDTSWDQRRVPQGTALFELYATGNPNNPALPRELYSLNPTTGNLTLDLARTVTGTTTTAGTQTYPVWRLAITQSHYQGEVPETNTSSMNMSIADRLREFPGTCSLELRDPGMSLVPTSVCSNVVTAAGQFIPIERVVTFVQNPPATFNAKAGLTQSKTTANITTNIDVFYFYTPTTNTSFAQVLPGDYVVVGPGRDVVSGPRNITTLGRTLKGTSANPKMIVTTTSGPITFTSYNQPQSIIDMGDPSVPGRYFLHTSVNGVDEYPIRYVGANPLPGLVQPTTVVPNTVLDIPTFLQIRPPVSVPCMATVGSRRVGLNISEPLTTVNYYPTPTLTTTDDWDVSLVQTDTYAKVYDKPLDENTTGTLSGTNHNPNIPHNANEYEDRTLLNFKTVFLQRLADPTRAWDQYLNPYLTIDWMPIDLTIFNGEPHFVYRDPPNSGSWKKDVTKAAHLIDPIKQTRLLNAHPTVASDIPTTAIRFGSRQRGAPRTPFRGNYSYYDLWSQPNWLDTSSDFDTRPPLTDSVSKSDVKIARTLGATPPPPTGPPVTKTYYAVDPVRWTDPFDHTFGYLNLGYHTMRAPTTSDRATLPMQQAPNWIAAATSLPDSVNKPWLRMSPVREPLRRPFGGQNNPPLKTGLYSGWFTAADVGSNTRYVGSPRRPFNWLTWNNRPYAGSMELMLVPASSPGRLLHDYSMRITTPPAVPNDGTSDGLYSFNYAPYSARRAANHYMPPVRVPNNATTSGHTNAAASVYAGTFMAGFINKAPYGHLLNFFESSNATGAGLPTNGYTQQTGASNYFRLFEFINVPSRMSGTRTPHYTGQQGGLSDTRFLYNGVYNTNNALGPGGTLEHPGWPFTVPYNLFSSYREPGRVNINTIVPLSSRSFTRDETSTNVNYMAQVIRNERLRDDGAGIWRSLVNDFFPAIRWLAGPNSTTPTPDVVDGLNPAVPLSNPYQQAAKTISHLRQQNSSTISGKTGIRAGQMQASTDVTFSPYFFNPSEDTVGNFYSAYASMFKDDPNSDPRGPNGVYENWQFWNRATGAIYSDDRLLQPFWDGASPASPPISRHDGLRPSMFSNPFRSFMSDFSATPPSAPSGLLATNKRFSAFQTGGANSNLPLLAVDSTLLRRRDTSWNPWSTLWLPSEITSIHLSSAQAGTNTNTLYSPAQIDPRFDPLFALNYPRPFRQRAGVDPSTVDIFSVSAVPGTFVPGPPPNPNNIKPKWWSYSGHTSSLAHYIDGPEATSFLKYGTSATAPGIDGIRVKDSDYRNTDRNPFFRYQLYTKLSNTITTRSNVYAVWITVGYFECERVQPNVIYPVQFGHANNTEFAVKHRYPDGYRIIRELGSDNGETQRHRAFAILDRTIPVGFLRGENLNVDRCFLIKRIID